MVDDVPTSDPQKRETNELVLLVPYHRDLLMHSSLFLLAILPLELLLLSKLILKDIKKKKILAVNDQLLIFYIQTLKKS